MTTPPLQPGQYWRTRAGSIVYVDSILPEWAGISLPVIVIWKRDSGGHKVVFYHSNGFHFVNRESPHDLITYLPDCDSLDCVPPKYPAYVMSSNGSDHYAYIRRDSDTSGEIVYKSGHAEPYVWHEGSQKLIADGVRVYITKEQAESRVQKPVPPEYPKYYKSSTESFGYFRVDSKESYFWVTPDGREVRQCGSPSMLLKSPFTEITKAEADTRVKRSDAPELPGDRSKHTAPYVYSLIGEASKHNDYHSFENASVSIGCLIRICSAQQSMLSELSAQVDTLRSEITSGETR